MDIDDEKHDDNNDDDDDDDEDIDEEQLQEYREMVDQLGNFPDKVTINSLSMVAEDHAESKSAATKIYGCIRERLQSVSISRDRKLPLVYVIDSILKNVKGTFIPIIEQDAKVWMPVVYHSLPTDSQREKLKKVWKTWKEFNIFHDNSWKEMGMKCGFSEEDILPFIKGSSSSTTTSASGTSNTGGGTTTGNSASGGGEKSESNNSTDDKLAGVTRAKDGSLQLTSALRKEMQNILDELQSDIENELDKVSLERLADINPDLFNNILNTAKTNLNQATNNKTRGGPGGGADSNSGGNSGGGMNMMKNNNNNNANHDDDMLPYYIPPYFTEIRSPTTLMRSKAWNKLELDHKKQSHDLISKIQQSVRKICSSYSDEQYQFTQSEAIEMTHTLACASAIATILTNELQSLQNQEESQKEQQAASAIPAPNTTNPLLYGAAGGIVAGVAGVANGMIIGGSSISAAMAIDQKDFTNDGIKKKNMTVIGILYEVGLPFLSSSDGRRFGTQLELSNHLDALFKRSQLEKSMARTEERGWYFDDTIWTGEINNYAEKMNFDKNNSGGAGAGGIGGGDGMDGNNDNNDNIGGGSLDDHFDDDDTKDPSTYTVPADESKDRCAVCGINFRMFFDNDEGMYKYNNCREITVFHDDAAAVESEVSLIHVTCWRGLGKPKDLTADQTLQL